MDSLRKYVNLACVGVLLLLVGMAMGGKGCNVPWPVVPVTPVTPATPHAPAVVKVAAALKSNPLKAAALADFYDTFATGVDRTPPATVGAFSASHAEQLSFLPSSAKSPPMVGAEIDAALAEIIGLNQDDPIAPKKTELVARMRDLAAALKEVK